MMDQDAIEKVADVILDKVISLQEIKEKAKGVVISIPDWDGKGTIKVRVRHIDLTPALMETGVLPDELSAEVVTMFEGESKKGSKKENTKAESPKIKMEKLMPMMNTVVKEALVEPTYDEIQEIYPLTSPQKMAIFSFITGGVAQLKPFRT